jgi:hypothetical protein
MIMPALGPLSPSVSPAAPNVGSAATPQGNQGNAVQAMSLVRNGLEMFQKALPLIPMGSPLHSDLLKATANISKHMDQSASNKGVDLQSLLQMARQSSQQSPVQALNRMHPGGAPAAPAMLAPPEAA